jgi:hypothetical protein
MAETFTKKAAELIAEMVKAGWSLRIDITDEGTRCIFHRIVTAKQYGQFCRGGDDPDLFEAARKARAELKEGDR